MRNFIFKSALCVLVVLSFGTASALAPAGRFQVVGNQLPGQGNVIDTQTGLTWQSQTFLTSMTWSQAVAACSSHPTGWRLPSVKELVTLVDMRAVLPALDTVYFPDLRGDVWHWASTTTPHTSNVDPTIAGASAYTVGFSNGTVSYSAKTNRHYVTCVK